MKRLALVVLFMFCFQVNVAQAFYAIDGDVSDWGIILGEDSLNEGYLDSHLPTGGNDIEYVTEDNADIYDGTTFVGPAYSTGNIYDAEAIYFDNDSVNAYIAIVLGTPQTGVTFSPGDVFIDAGLYQNPDSGDYNLKKYAFGVDVNSGDLYSVNSWLDVQYSAHGDANPWKMGTEKTLVSDEIEFVYSDVQNSHYVMEMSIPLEFLGLTATSGTPQSYAWIHWTMKCGNDYLNLKGDVTSTPEPASLFLMGSGLLGIVFKRRKMK